MVAWSAQTLAHGATALLFFRYRAALYGQEQFCYGILDHSTPPASGRKWEEAKQVYALAQGEHSSLWMAPVVAKVAVLYDPTCIFAWQAQPQSTAFDFSAEANRLFKPFWRFGVQIDVISWNKIETGAVNLDHYKIILLPAPMLISDKAMSMLTVWTHAGGSLWTGFRSDLKTVDTNQMRTSPSRLADLAGVQVSEIESLNVGTNSSVRASGSASTASIQTTVWRDGLQIVANGTESIFEYEDNFFGALSYKAMTRRLLDSGGEVVYLATGIDPAALEDCARYSLRFQKLDFLESPECDELEQLMRADINGNIWDIRINYGATSAKVANLTSIPAYGVSILPHA